VCLDLIYLRQTRWGLQLGLECRSPLSPLCPLELRKQFRLACVGGVTGEMIFSLPHGVDAVPNLVFVLLALDLNGQ
jgi:hypothetical protein